MDSTLYSNPIAQPGTDNRWMYYDFLHFIPTEQKNKYWAAQCLLFNKLNSSPLLPNDPDDKVARYRELERGEIRKSDFVKIVDPPQADGSGGKAEFFATKWKSNLINIHLRNILDARLDGLPISLQVRAADEYFQLEQQKENARIIGRRQFLAYVNDMNARLGLPQLRTDDDPFKYVNQMSAGTTPGKEGKPADMGGGRGAAKDTAITLMDNLKSMMDDNEDLALYNEYVYKDGCEVACELGMEHYLTVNKFSEIKQEIFTDLRNFNTCALRLFTSTTNGQPVIDYYDPSTVWTSAFKKADGGDITYWWREADITFADFVRQFGAELDDDQLRYVFEKNRTNQGGWQGHQLYWDKCNRWQRDNARIRVGYMEWLSQDIAVYSYAENVRGNMRFKQMPSDWFPPKKSAYERQERYYNAWYKCYYIPTFVGTYPGSLQTTDFVEQAKLIFGYGKLQDQYREGDDLRYSRPSLIVRRRTIPSFTDIEQRYMDKIDLLWIQMENDLANVIPHGLWFGEEAFTELLNTVDEAQAGGKDDNYEAMRKLKQTGYGVGKLFDEMGRRIPPFVDIKTGHLQSAREKLVAIMDIYAMMTRALGLNEIAEGVAPQPRQSLGGIELANSASVKATLFIENAYTDTFNEIGWRMLYYFKEVVGEKNSERLREFQDIVGRASAWALEAIADLPLRRVGVAVDVLNTNAQNVMINQLALQMSQGANPLITPDEAVELTFINNAKYKFAILRMKMKKRRKENMALQQQMVAVQRENLQMQSQIKLQEIQAKYQGEAALQNMMKQWDERLLQIEAQLKFMSQSQIKEQIKNNRMEQDANAMQLQQQYENQKPLV
ncbi:hypothetical protein PV783_34280 [Chitinophaga sp. CC14]|uniref:hypothetical protein n=1 Tax=Chitinophaga sp. CC14 TaxID=3029199 RepID=UPI003B7D357F